MKKTVLIVAVAAMVVFFVARHERGAERFFDVGKAYYDEDNNYDSAAAYFTAAAGRKPRRAKYHYWMGRAFHQKKDYAEAIAAYTEAIRLEPGNAKAYAYRGGAYSDRLEEGDNANALMDFYRSIGLNPDYAVKLPEISGPLKVSGVWEPDYDDRKKLYLCAIITDSVLNLGARRGFMPGMFLRESRRYVTKGGLDTVIDYSNDRRPVNRRTGKAFTEDELAAVYLYGGYLNNREDYLTDSEREKIQRAMYTKSGEMLTDAEGDRLDSVSVGDTVYALANPRRMIIVSDPNEFENRPLSVFDEHLNRLMKVKDRYRDEVNDSDDIVIFREAGASPDKIMKLIYAARIAGYPNIDLMSLDSNKVFLQWRSYKSARLSQNEKPSCCERESKGKQAVATDTCGLTETTPPVPVAVFTDRRDGKRYKKVKIGKMVWMAENLNYDFPRVTTDVCFENCAGCCAKYGRLYNWPVAMRACPAGWRLPNDAEWRALVDYAGGSETAGKKLKSVSGWKGNGNGTDDFGFSALPGSIGDAVNNFVPDGEYGGWWSATEYNEYGNAMYWGMGHDRDSVHSGPGGMSFQFSVRCVQK